MASRLSFPSRASGAQTVLLADIGGTTTRVARAGRDGALFDIRLESNDSYGHLSELLLDYLAQTGGERPRMAVLAVAAPVDGEEVRLVNRAWSFSRGQLAEELGLDRLDVENDFVALGHGIPCLKREDLLSLGAWRTPVQGVRLVCGPGTGLGAALLAPRGDGYEVLASEAGHMRFGAVTTDEARLLAHMVRDLGPVAVEHVLSGPGLERLHRILSGEELSSRAIIKAAVSGQTSERESCHVFLRVLGRVLGDLALAFEARGGVYVAGGIGRALAPLMMESPLREAFEDHPPFNERLAQVPLHIITHATPGLLGVGEIGRRLLLAQA
ncbi:glucokinase [Xanthobacter sp. TB0139]|uniref:glucokinase n=1 Tax=Xanthobacter sp. TB0139 TaxID=3459178 RepID=UPI00403A3077